MYPMDIYLVYLIRIVNNADNITDIKYFLQNLPINCDNITMSYYPKPVNCVDYLIITSLIGLGLVLMGYLADQVRILPFPSLTSQGG